MSEFIDVIESRRSANNFLEGEKITKKDLTEILDLVKLAPSCFNIQHAHYFVIMDKENKELLREAALGQYKVHTASAAVLVLGDKEAYKESEKVYSGMNKLGILSDEDYHEMLGSIKGLYEGGGEVFKRDEAIRNASLSAMMFMLIAKEKGWDTCPMIGFDPEKVRETFHIPDRYELVLLITIGKENTKNRRLRGYRKTIDEFATFESFK